MFLNLSPPKTPQEQWQLRGWAVFSVMLQAAVLVFSGCATYHPRMSFKKDSRQVEPYAYPLTAGGTMLVVLGVLVCSLVVEWSTDEKVWKLDPMGRILWLQKGGNFNDQQFGSYAVFARGVRRTILTSKLFTDKRPEKTGQDRRTPAQVKIRSPSREILVVLAAATSIGGFIAQFTGLRGMHWSATIAQLVATLIMVGIRAWIRRDLASFPVEYTVPKGHEMDWLATRITKKHDCDRLWEESEQEEKQNPAPGPRNAHLFRLPCSTLQRLPKLFTRQTMKDAGVGNRSGQVFDEICPEDDRELFNEKCRDWEIVTGEGVDDFTFQDLRPQDENSNGHRIMEMRKRIGSLCNWTGPASDPAISLAKAIEVVMDSLFPTTAAGDVDEVWCWTMNCRSHDGSSNPILLSVKRNGKSGFTWKSSATELEAVLSLWIYSIHTENINMGRGKVGSKEGEKNEKSGNEEDWLRDGNAAVRTATLRRLGQGTKPYLRDLRWYLGDKFDIIKEINETNERTPSKPTNSKLRTREINNSRVVGFQKEPNKISSSLTGDRLHVANSSANASSKKPSKPLGSKTTFQIQDLDLDIEKASESGGTNAHPQLAVISETPAEVLFTQDMFSTFMWAVAERMDPLGNETSGNTTLHPLVSQKQTADAWKSFRLDNMTLSKLTRDVERAAGQCLGTLEDIKLSILPPLSLHRKLPIPLCLIEYAKALAKPHEAANRWEEAGNIYLWLFEECLMFGKTHSLAVKGTAILSAYCRKTDTLKDLRDQRRNKATIESLTLFETRLKKKLDSSADSSVRENLDALRSIQTSGKIGAPEAFKGFEEAKPSHREVILAVSGRHNRLESSHINPADKDLLDLTPLHYAVILGNKRIVFQLLQRGADPNHADVDEWTPLHYAVKSDSEDIARALLKHSPQLAAENFSGLTALHHARSGSMARILLEAGAQPDIPARDGTTALHWAAIYHGNHDVATCLIEFGANVYSVDSLRRTPLHYAAYHGYEGMVEILKKKGTNTAARDDRERTPLHLAALSGKLTEKICELLDIMHDGLISRDISGLTPLHLAAENNHDEVVRLLGGRGDSNGQTTLSWAAQKGNVEVVQLLCEHPGGVDFNSKYYHGRTPLSWAAENGHVEVVCLLCERDDVEVDLADENGGTPLLWAAQKGHVGVVRLLCKQGGVDVNLADENGRTPLLWAAQKGHVGVVRLLCELAGSNGHTPLPWAAENGHVEVVRLLCEQDDVDINLADENGRTPLLWAAQKGRVGVVRLLCERDSVDVNSKDHNGQTPLSRAAENGHVKVVRLLCERDSVDVNSKDHNGQTPLSWAAVNEHMEVVRLLCKRNGIDFNLKHLNKRAQLSWAAKNGQMEMVRLLLSEWNSVDINSKDHNGQTPLSWAAMKGHVEVVRLLCQRNSVDINSKDHTGRTPLSLAAMKGHVEVVRLLLSERNSVDINSKDHNGQTPLSRAAETGHVEVVRLLCQRNSVDINSIDNSGQTPLSWAAETGHVEVVRLLCQRNSVDINLKDHTGRTPLSSAAMKGHVEVVRLLSERNSVDVASKRRGLGSDVASKRRGLGSGRLFGREF